MGTLSEDLTAIKNVEDTLIANKVARFSYTDTAYTNNDADGVDNYDYDNEQNIPNPTTSILKVNSTVLDKGYRAQASSITRMLVNHFFGRVSYNLNKINDNMSALIATLRTHTGTANGFATLDENGRIPYSQLPESAVELKGYWNASTNTPTLADGTGTNGDEYFVDTAGSQDLGSGTQYFKVGDRVVYTGGIWKNIDSGAIRTINGQAPNPQGERSVIVGQNVPMTRGFLGAVFGKFLGKTWEIINVSIHVKSLYYANGLWLYASASGAYWSEDGRTWTQSNLTVNTEKFYYANNLWVCGTRSDGLYWSEDGKTWVQSNVTTNTGGTVEYAEGLWVSCMGNGLYWSEDGKTWTQCTGISQTTTGVTFANNIWVCGSSSTGAWWSTDGKVWTQGTGGLTTYQVYCVAFANNLWVCGTQYNGVWWSTDGKAWTQGTGYTSMTKVITYANGVWVLGTGIGDKGAWYSTDGKAWTQCTGLGNPYAVTDISYANGVWISVGSYLWWSEDGKTWTNTLISTDDSTSIVAYGNGAWLSNRGTASLNISDITRLIEQGVINLGADIPLVNS